MNRYAKSNKGYNYILVLIDVTSKFAWTQPLKSLKGKEIVSAFRHLLKKVPENIRTDGGSEFNNSDVKKYLRSRGVNHFSTNNEKKANIAERLIITLKSRITKYMHETNSHEWTNVLRNITAGYNNTYHRSIGMTPTQALETNDVTLWKKLYTTPLKKKSITSLE